MLFYKCLSIRLYKTWQKAVHDLNDPKFCLAGIDESQNYDKQYRFRNKRSFFFKGLINI